MGRGGQLEAAAPREGAGCSGGTGRCEGVREKGQVGRGQHRRGIWEDRQGVTEEKGKEQEDCRGSWAGFLPDISSFLRDI